MRRSMQRLRVKTEETVAAPKLDVLTEYIKKRLGLVKADDVRTRVLRQYTEFGNLAKLSP